MVVNRTRLILAVLLLTLAHWFLLGSWFPLAAEPQRWFWLGLSGFVGLVLGDAFLFQAFIWIGPRLSMLMMSLAPVIATLVAWIFLGERLSVGEIGGIFLTLLGIAWVVLEGNHKNHHNNRDYVKGILFGFGAATGQALGLVLAKNGLGGDFSPISGNLIRMLTAMILLWGITILQRQARNTIIKITTTPEALRFVIVGVITGPFLGVSLSLFAIQQTEIGIASTLMALPPIFLLPISFVYFKERFGWRVIAGTFVAIAGVALLFLV